jgi:hypothetical protein
MDEFKGWAYDVVLELLKSSDKSAHPQLSDARTNTSSRVRTCIHEQFPMLARANTALQLVASVGVPHTLALVWHT